METLRQRIRPLSLDISNLEQAQSSQQSFLNSQGK